METLCKIREIYRAVSAFEGEMEKTYNLCLNEGMLLCSLSKTDKLSSGEIAESLGLTTSNTSKVIKSVENKDMIKRVIGNTDKRQMYFSLTPKGKEALSVINCNNIKLPDLLQDILNKG
ncbi:MAG: MarR family transcriptional regulator [Prevotella sp.]|jgi:DNA-binding MarR family transcriptional regulator|nr:MarR family transcriptional regulator [Prevotella sp.]MBP8038286.1 MarR family transcriptional regulator [Prevotella sp.]MBP8757062.1 MarR family transcriptional regulator [Prevotella sp.]MBP9984912.1 MarR family transcriptional regulator [Prevotella sp.]MDY0153962.1 MarR family transcriptional regulator [Prevotella sp.]